MTGDRRGIALVAVLLLLLTATALAHGALLLARSELRASGARAREARVASLADVAVTDTWARGLSAEAADVPVWGSVSLEADVPGSVSGVAWPGEVHAHRLAEESWWLAYAPEPMTPPRVGMPGRLLWWLGPAARLRALGAVITVGTEAPVSILGTVDRTSFGRAAPPLNDELCAVVDEAGLSDLVPAAVQTLPDTLERPGLGLLAFDEILARTPVVVEGPGSPSPDGVCTEADPWRWGDPDRPDTPCGRSVVVRAAPAGLRLEGGAGQAALVVDGDFALTGDARLFGFVLATGALILRDQAELHGVAVAAGGVVIESAARVHGSACWALRALRAGRDVWMPGPMIVPDVGPIGP